MCLLPRPSSSSSYSVTPAFGDGFIFITRPLIPGKSAAPSLGDVVGVGEREREIHLGSFFPGKCLFYLCYVPPPPSPI